MDDFFLGIDIGGTKIAGGLVDFNGQVSNRHERPTPIKSGGQAILAEAISLSGFLIDEAKTAGKSVAAIGIGAGGQIDSVQGLVFSATDVLPGWKGIKIVEPFKAALGLPARVDNDVNVLAAGEWRFGAASTLRLSGGAGTVLFLALGTGVGGALLKDGQIHHGAHWSGGEFGHILLSMADDARADIGGARGTLEAYCSGPGLVATYNELSPSAPVSSGEQVVSAAAAESASGKKNGPGLRSIFLTGQYLGFGLTTLANALDPDLIIIGGGLASLGEQILAPARSIVQDRALPGPATCRIVTAAAGNDAAIIGAASLVMS